MYHYDLVVIGGGPAGMAAAISAKKSGVDNIVILESENQLGGVLNQCIHHGFGTDSHRGTLTGPEYAQVFIDDILKMDISYKLNTRVLDLNKEKEITAVNDEDGILDIQAKSVILATGSREKLRWYMNILGSRCAGIYTAGSAQQFINIYGVLPGRNIVIIGTSDIALTMASRMTLEGSEIKAIIESKPYIISLDKKRIQYLKDFAMPLKLSSILVDIDGEDRIEGVTIAKIDENRKIISETKEHIDCDTLILTVPLYPENELAKKAGAHICESSRVVKVDDEMQTSINGIFACGNLLHGYEMVEEIIVESRKAGINASNYILNKAHSK